jgi:hypothetical protein
MQQFILDLRGQPAWLTPLDSTEAEGPQIIIGCISHPLTCKCITNNSSAVSVSGSLGPISMVTLWMENANISVN